MEAKLIKYTETNTLEVNDGTKVITLLRNADTNGMQAIFEDIVAAGAGPDRHIHHKQDETFIFLEGEFLVEVEGKSFQAKPGDVAFIPKGAVHAWKNVGKGVGRLRYIFSPALNIEDMFQDLHDIRLAGDSGEEVMEALKIKYPEQEIVGPPL